MPSSGGGSGTPVVTSVTMLTTSAEFVAYNGGSGFYRPQAVEDALILAEGELERYLNTALIPRTEVDEFPWPTRGNKMMLRKVRVISITEAEGLTSDGSCGWVQGDDISECTTILDARQSIVRATDPFMRARWCSGSRCPERMRVSYTYGFTAAQTAADTLDGKLLRAAVFNMALGFLQTGIGLNAQGNVFINSYTAAGYSESRQLPEMSGAMNYMNQHILMATEMVRRLKVKRAIPFGAMQGGVCT